MFILSDDAYLKLLRHRRDGVELPLSHYGFHEGVYAGDVSDLSPQIADLHLRFAEAAMTFGALGEIANDVSDDPIKQAEAREIAEAIIDENFGCPKAMLG